MDNEKSLKISGKIARAIAEQALYIDYSLKEVEAAEKDMPPQKKAELKSKGFLDYDFEKYYVMDKFAQNLGLYKKADEEYLKKFFSLSRKFSPSEFMKDPFIRRVKLSEKRDGNILITNSGYGRGEFFQYAMPDLRADLVVPKIGFFTGEVSFPTVYEGNMPWMSACPSEISSMKKQMKEAFGNVLVLGLGLGYYPFIVSGKKEVKKVTVIEIQPQIIKLFNENIFPFFDNKGKIEIIEADAFKFLESVKDGEYDYCFADIWEGQEDGAKCYKRIKPFEKKLPNTRFSYWIEDEIRWYIEREQP